MSAHRVTRLRSVAKTWVLTGSLDNFRATREHGFRVIGAKEGRRGMAEQIEPGDRIAFYVTGVQAFGGIVRVTGEMYEDRDEDLARQAGQGGRRTRGASRPSRRSCSTRTSSCRPWSWPASSSTSRKWPAEHWHLAFQGQLRTVVRRRRRAARAPHPRRGRARRRDPRSATTRSRRRPRCCRAWWSCSSGCARARDRLGDREAREALSEAGPTNGGGDPGRTVSEGFVELRDSMAELRELRGRAARPRPRPARLPLAPRRPRGLPVLAGGRGRDRVLARARGRLRGPAPARRWR